MSKAGACPSGSGRFVGQRPRLIIADDHGVFADTLRLLLQAKYEVVAQVSDGCKLVAEAIRLAPHLLIVDVGMPLLNGYDAVCRIREKLPQTKVVFLTMQQDPVLAAAAEELGAGFVLKNSAASELMDALDAVLDGVAYISKKVRAEDWVIAKARAKQSAKELTSRQRQIIQLFGEGRSTKEVAALLNLSEKTVEFHKYHLMDMFGLKSNADIVIFALKQGLISVDLQTSRSVGSRTR